MKKLHYLTEKLRKLERVSFFTWNWWKYVPILFSLLVTLYAKQNLSICNEFTKMMLVAKMTTLLRHVFGIKGANLTSLNHCNSRGIAKWKFRETARDDDGTNRRFQFLLRVHEITHMGVTYYTGILLETRGNFLRLFAQSGLQNFRPHDGDSDPPRKLELRPPKNWYF